MSLPREPFSWEGNNEQPVPLDRSGPNDAKPMAPDILSEAETVVRAAQQAIGREDTQPTITIPVPDRGVITSIVSRRFPGRTDGARSLSALALVTTAGCAVAFLHGWSVGANTAEGAPSRSCVPHHCPVDSSGKK
jgi:hypothetical protein